MFENFNSTPKKSLAEDFRKLSQEKNSPSLEVETFGSLEDTLFENGFSLAGSIEIGEVIGSASLICRSEQFTKVIDLIESGIELEISNDGAWANMCTMSAGRGFKIALTEGFSGKDVGNVVKTVISFSGSHLESATSIPKKDELWKTKPETASVSLVGKGLVAKDDLRMVSFRFPIVRHYVPNKKTASSYKN